MAKKILPLCVISLGTKGDQLKADQSIQSTGLTIKVNTKALYLSCGFWPDKTIILDSGRNAHCSCLGQAGPMGAAVLKIKGPGLLPCSTHHIWGALPLPPLLPDHIRSQPQSRFTPFSWIRGFIPTKKPSRITPQNFLSC